jgi:serine/threonine protein kinase
MGHPTKKKKIGRFELLGQLGRGSNGSVFLAEDPTLDRQVAIKVLHEVARTRAELDGYLREGRLLAQLRHPNIVSVFEAGSIQGRPYLVFEYIQGRTLRSLLNERPFGRDRALELIDQVLDALAYAHTCRILHLDLNPTNIMIDHGGGALVMDFGLSTPAHITTSPAVSTVAGTPRYISPEHVTTLMPTARSEVFTLGLIAYEVLVGRPLIESEGMDDILEEVRNAEFDLSRLDRLHINAPLKEVIARALKKHPNDRYANAAEMLRAFRDACADLDKAKHDPREHSTVDFMLRRMRRNQDFPALSNNLLAINRLTGGDSKASAAQLANVILRDYSITNKLLKLANSAYYGSFGGTVTNVSRAISILGFDQVREACNCLLLFDNLGNKNNAPFLRDCLTHSFVSGLIARHIAVDSKALDAEEAFICGMLHNLGRTLAIYYFADDFAAMQELMAQEGVSEDVAAESVLGVRLHVIGQAVAKEWQFPEPIIESMRPLDTHPWRATEDETMQSHGLRRIAAVANALADIAMFAESHGEDCCQTITLMAEPLFGLDENRQLALLNAALKKYSEFARVLGLNNRPSEYLERTQDWLLARIEIPLDTQAAKSA